MLKGLKISLLSCLIMVPIFQKANAEDLKIGYVNTERVIRESPAAIKASGKMAQEFEARRQELQRIADDIELRKTALSEKGASLSDSERRAKEAELAEISARLKRKQQEFQDDIKIRQDEAMSDTLAKANKIIVQIAKSEHFDIIFQEAVSVSNRLDITAKVIQKLTED